MTPVFIAIESKLFVYKHENWDLPKKQKSRQSMSTCRPRKQIKRNYNIMQCFQLDQFDLKPAPKCLAFLYKISILVQLT